MPVGRYPDRCSFGGEFAINATVIRCINRSVLRPVQETAQGNRAAGKLAVNRSSGLGICNQG